MIAQGSFGDVYEPSWNRALNELGVKSNFFETHSLTLPGIIGRVERRILWGPGVARIKKNFIALVKRERPSITLLYQGHYFDKETLNQIRPYTFIAGYHNDDPFGPRKTTLRYRLMLPALPLYHCFHVYRQCNVEEAIAHGVQRVKVLMPYYLPWFDYPRKLSRGDLRKWGCDIVFAGHWENDMRVRYLIDVVERGINLRLYGQARFWRPALPAEIYRKVKPVELLFGEEYRRALCGAKIAACFFSRWNRDQYTRRCFEIPACGVFLLSERTQAMQEIYKEGEEAEYFSSSEEFLDKVRFYINNENARQRIAQAGYFRVTQSGHDIYSRMQQWLRDVSEWKTELEKE